jgi:hypothetical protein
LRCWLYAAITRMSQLHVPFSCMYIPTCPLWLAFRIRNRTFPKLGETRIELDQFRKRGNLDPRHNRSRQAGLFKKMLTNIR